MATLPILRRSAMQAAGSCLYRYNKIWNEGVPDKSVPALIGIGFHACAHAYVVRLFQTKLEADEEEARHAFHEGIGHALTPSHLVPEVKQIFFGWARHFSLNLG